MEWRSSIDANHYSITPSIHSAKSDQIILKSKFVNRKSQYQTILVLFIYKKNPIYRNSDLFRNDYQTSKAWQSFLPITKLPFYTITYLLFIFQQELWIHRLKTQSS
jgi:hypothetical protein